MLICSAHGTVIDREHRECRAETVSRCIMSERGGQPFSDYELDYLESVESWRTRLLEDAAPLTHQERDAIAEVLMIGLQDFLLNGPHDDPAPEEGDT